MLTILAPWNSDTNDNTRLAKVERLGTNSTRFGGNHNKFYLLTSINNILMTYSQGDGGFGFYIFGLY